MTVPFSGRLSFCHQGPLTDSIPYRNGGCPDQLRKEINYEVMKFSEASTERHSVQTSLEL